MFDKVGRITCADAGRIGGQTTLTRHGVEHFRRAGTKGQASLSKKYGKEDRKKWGSMGGRPEKAMITLEEKLIEREVGSPPDSTESPPSDRYTYHQNNMHRTNL